MYFIAKINLLEIKQKTILWLFHLKCDPNLTAIFHVLLKNQSIISNFNCLSGYPVSIRNNNVQVKGIRT